VQYELTDRFVVKADLATTWRFFSSAENLPLITPPWLAFNVRTPPPVTIQRDSLLDYTIRWCGVPVRWRTQITDWLPPRQFVDVQLAGPYKLWRHTHTFEPAGDGEVICADHVAYELPLGPLGRLTHGLLVRRQLLEIFRYRRRMIAERLGWSRAVQDDVQIHVR
jgi:ligand-binding SRPBCC domain-containing protein